MSRGPCDEDEESDLKKDPPKKKEKCKNCEGKGTLKKGDKVVRCQRCDGTGVRQRSPSSF
jgi:DnaJ-class molecular chaperone